MKCNSKKNIIGLTKSCFSSNCAFHLQYEAALNSQDLIHLDRIFHNIKICFLM